MNRRVVDALGAGDGWSIVGGKAARWGFPLPEGQGRLLRVQVEGALALEAGPPGTVGAVLSLCDDQAPVWSLRLVSGRHFSDARDLAPVYRLNGDGSWVETVGQRELQGSPARVDRLVCEVPGGLGARRLVLGAVGRHALFALASVRLEFAAPGKCPFHSESDAVSLAELGLVLRTANRPRFDQALDQLREGMLRAEDDDEARGLGLTFAAVVAAATLELGAPRSAHRAQLSVAKELLAAEGREQIAAAAVRHAIDLAAAVFPASEAPTPVQAALALVDRHYASPLREAEVARRVGLSPSHFRFVFRQALREPFHRYLVGRRLEAARALLLQGGATVSEAAAQVGFASAAHFSRAFAKRFGCPPSEFRKAGGQAQTSQNSHYVA